MTENASNSDNPAGAHEGSNEDEFVQVASSIWPLLNLTEEPAFIALRRQHFGERTLDLVAITGKPLGYFQRLRSAVGGIPTEFIQPLTGWESTGWLGCDAWNAGQWDQALAVLRASGGWDIFQSLWQSPAEMAQLDRATRAAGLRCLSRPSPLRVIHGFNCWDDYHQAMNKKKRVRHKNTMKLLLKQNLHVTFDATNAQINELFARRVLRMNASDNAKDHRYLAFLSAWLDVLRAEKRLETVAVWHGEKLVAVTIGFWRGRVFLFNYTAYDPEYRAASPGSIAIYKLIEVALNKRAELFTFMGNYTYEKLFSSQTLECHRVDVFSGNLKARLLHGIMKLRQNKKNELAARQR